MTFAKPVLGGRELLEPFYRCHELAVVGRDLVKPANGYREPCYPLILHLVDFLVSRQSIEQVHLFMIIVQKFSVLYC